MPTVVNWDILGDIEISGDIIMALPQTTFEPVKHYGHILAGLRVYFNQGDCFVIRPIDNEDTLEIIDRLRIVTLGCEVR